MLGGGSNEQGLLKLAPVTIPKEKYLESLCTVSVMQVFLMYSYGNDGGLCGLLCFNLEGFCITTHLRHWYPSYAIA